MNKETPTKGRPPKDRLVQKQVPWMNKLEFETVYSKLYSLDLVEQKWAVRRITAWAARCHSAQPAGIAATEALVRAVNQDCEVWNNMSPSDFSDVSLMHYMAIIQFVNIISEEYQRHDYKVPLRHIAAKHGIPDWIVELRQNAAHTNHPHSIENLRSATKTCLEWIKEHYWKSEVASCVDFYPVSCNQAEVICRKALLDFQKSQYESLFDTEKSGRKRKRGVRVRPSTKQTVTVITSLAKTNGECLINILARPEFLLSVAACSKPLLENSDPFIEKQAVTLPENVELFWLPVICAVHQQDLLGNLVLTLLKSHNKLSDANQRMAIAWIWNILKASAESWGSNKNKDSRLSKALKNKTPLLNWFELLDVCLHSLSKYIPAVLPIIVEHNSPRIPEKKKNCLMGLVAIATGALADVHLNEDVSTEGQKVYTVENMKTVLELQDVVDRGETSLLCTEDSEDHWKLCTDDINREEIPIGHVFGVESGVPGPNDLEIGVLPQMKNEEKNGPTNEPGAVTMEGDVSMTLNGSTEVPVDSEKTEDTLGGQEDESPITKDCNASICEEDIIVF